MELQLDDFEKKAVQYLENKLKPKSIKVLSVSTEASGEIAVSGSLQEQDGPTRKFEVKLRSLGGDLISIEAWNIS
jgi:hypothetical protein